MTVTTGENEFIAGTAKVQLALDATKKPVFTGGVLTASGTNTVTLNCAAGFVPGTTYYIAVAPAAYTSIKIALDGEVVKESAAAKTLAANTVYSLGELADLPVETTPEPSEWALVGAFVKGDTNWKEIQMVTTSTPDLFVAKNVEVPMDYTSMLIKKYGDSNWSVKFGGGIVYFNPGNWMTVYSGGADISITKAGTYDFYFDYNGKKLYVVAPGADYAAASEQKTEGQEPEQEEPEEQPSTNPPQEKQEESPVDNPVTDIVSEGDNNDANSS